MIGFAKLMAVLGLDAKDYHREMEKAKADAGGFEKAWKGFSARMAGMISVGTVIAGLNKMREAISGIRDESQQMGVSVETFQVLREKAQTAGIKMEQLAAVFSKIRAAQGDALNGQNSPVVKALKDLNIEVADFVSASPERAFEMLSQKVKTAGGDVKQLSAVFNIIGKEAGPRFQQLMSEIGAKGIESMADAMRKDGALVSDSMVNTMADIENAVTKTWNRVTAKTANALQKMARWSGKDWLKAAVTPLGLTAADLVMGENKETQADISARQVAKLDEEKRAKEARAAAAKAEQEAKAKRDTESRWKAMQELARLEEQLSQVKKEGEMAGMTPQQKKQELANDYGALQDRIMGLAGVKNAEAQILEYKIEQKKISNEIAAIDRQQAKEKEEREKKIRKITGDKDKSIADIQAGKGLSGFDPSKYADSLARIGGYVGGQMAGGMNLAERQLEVTEKIAAVIERFDDQMEGI